MTELEAERDALEADSANWRFTYEACRKNYDELAAYAEQLQSAGDALDNAFGAIMPGVKHIALPDYSVLNAGFDWQQVRSKAPQHSLARLIAQKQADALEEVAGVIALEDEWHADRIRRRAADIRRQAGA